jgi:hypothetical protein
MTDAEIHALAEDILTIVVADVNKIAPQACRVLRKANGDPFMEFVGTSKQGLGSFSCRYDPLESIKTLIAESQLIFDGFEVTLTNKRTNQSHEKSLKDCAGEDRDKIIRSMSLVAALCMVGAIFPRLTEMLEDGFEDGKMIAEGVLIMTVANSPDSPDEVLSHAKTDMSETVEQAALRAGERRRKYLQERLSNAQHVIATRGPGRKAKTVFEVKRDATEYACAVEDAYRAQRIAAGKPPTKTSVAEALGEGGRNFKTGTDSRLNTFNLKLSRLGVSYEEIVAKVESDLHKNSD